MSVLEEVVVAVDSDIPHAHLQRSDYLVSAAQAGSAAAFGELSDIYSQRVYRQLLAITKNREDAEDALQDALLRAYVSLRSFEGRSSFYSWLTRIAINSALMILRRRRARPEIDFNNPYEADEENPMINLKDESPSPEQLCAHRQRCARMLTSIGKLQPRLREVIEMQLRQNRSVKEIAQTLDISESAVKSRIFRARMRLTSTCGLKISEAKTHGLRRPRSAGSTACFTQQLNSKSI